MANFKKLDEMDLEKVSGGIANNDYSNRGASGKFLCGQQQSNNNNVISTARGFIANGSNNVISTARGGVVNGSDTTDADNSDDIQVAGAYNINSHGVL